MIKTPEFMPYIVFIAAPPLDQLRFMNEFGRHNLGLGAGRTYTVLLLLLFKYSLKTTIRIINKYYMNLNV